MSFIPELEEILNEGMSKRLDLISKSAEKMDGKTVKKVTVGLRKLSEDIHESDVLILEFTDGSVMHIQTGSNVNNLVSDFRTGIKRRFKPRDFHADFVITWEESNKAEAHAVGTYKFDIPVSKRVSAAIHLLEVVVVDAIFEHTDNDEYPQEYISTEAILRFVNQSSSCECTRRIVDEILSSLELQKRVKSKEIIPEGEVKVPITVWSLTEEEIDVCEDMRVNEVILVGDK